MSTVLESLAALVKRRQEKASNYPDLVRAYADGKPIDVEQTEAILTAAKKTAEDLQADVKAILRRRQLAEIAAKAPAITKRKEELTQQLQREHDAWIEKERLHRETVLLPITDDLQRLEAQSAECRDARRELIDSAPQYLKDRERELAQEHQAIGSDLNCLHRYAEAARQREVWHRHPETRRRVSQWEDIAPPVGIRLPALHDLLKSGDQTDAAEHYRKAAEMADAKIKELEPRKRELETQLQTIQANRLEP
jgi:hypothetical protein